jgi:hypothetical protein
LPEDGFHLVETCNYVKCSSWDSRTPLKITVGWTIHPPRSVCCGMRTVTSLIQMKTQKHFFFCPLQFHHATWANFLGKTTQEYFIWKTKLLWHHLLTATCLVQKFVQKFQYHNLPNVFNPIVRRVSPLSHTRTPHEQS